MVTGILRDPIRFWNKLDGLPSWKGRVPEERPPGHRAFNAGAGDWRTVIAHRVAGLGSLGRQRFVGIAMCRGGRVAREAKALAPSACVWAYGGKVSERIRYQQALDRSVRDRDPFVRLRGRWIVRRLAPDCSHVELSSMPRERDESKLLHAMGFETANVRPGHAGRCQTDSGGPCETSPPLAA